MKGKVYLITNTTSGKGYVGQTKNSLQHRFREHTQKKTPGIAQAIKKHGKENFTITLLEECEQCNLDERETFWINKKDTYRNGYNLTPGGGSQWISHSPEVRAKLSAAGKGKNTGDKNPARRPEVKAKIRAAALARVASGEWVSPTSGGHTEETKAKMRGKRKTNGCEGRVMSEETREKIRQAQLRAQARKRKEKEVKLGG